MVQCKYRRSIHAVHGGDEGELYTVDGIYYVLGFYTVV